MSFVNFSNTERSDRRYISAAMEAPYLEREQEFELGRRWRQDGDEAALHELIESHARLVVRIAWNFRYSSLPLGDLIQEGNIGLTQAATRFDPEREVRFSTYATWWIIAAIQDHILRYSSIVRFATTPMHRSLFFKLRRIRGSRVVKPDGTLSYDDRVSIASEFGVPLSEVERIDSHLASSDRSLNVPIGRDELEEAQDFLPDEGPTPEDLVAADQDDTARSQWLHAALDRLSPRERQIIVSRFLEDERSTLAEIGATFGVSKERIRQIERKALDKLRSALSERAEDISQLLGN